MHDMKKEASGSDASFVVRPSGFEPLAYRVGVCHSIQLSYGRIWSRGRLFPLATNLLYHLFRECKEENCTKDKKDC